MGKHVECVVKLTLSEELYQELVEESILRHAPLGDLVSEFIVQAREKEQRETYDENAL